jgi:hypothetical protein
MRFIAAALRSRASLTLSIFVNTLPENGVEFRFWNPLAFSSVSISRRLQRLCPGDPGCAPEPVAPGISKQSTYIASHHGRLGVDQAAQEIGDNWCYTKLCIAPSRGQKKYIRQRHHPSADRLTNVPMRIFDSQRYIQVRDAKAIYDTQTEIGEHRS